MEGNPYCEQCGRKAFVQGQLQKAKGKDNDSSNNNNLAQQQQGAPSVTPVNAIKEKVEEKTGPLNVINVNNSRPISSVITAQQQSQFNKASNSNDAQRFGSVHILYIQKCGNLQAFSSSKG